MKKARRKTFFGKVLIILPGYDTIMLNNSVLPFFRVGSESLSIRFGFFTSQAQMKILE